MTQRKKALDRLLTAPADFRWSELIAIMDGFGYELEVGSGFQRKFVHTATHATIGLHEPHPNKILKAYQIKIIIEFLMREGHLG